MKRRKYISAIAVVLGASGCIEEGKAPSRTEAMDIFTDITGFEAPMEEIDNAARFVDEEAGVVFWGFYHDESMSGGGNQFEVEAKHISDTNLEK